MNYYRLYYRLYKLDSKGKVRTWSIATSGNTYTQVHGILNGKLQSTTTVVPAGKNIGKANETTAEEQCQLEADALWKKKRDRSGYTEEIPTDKPLRPMLAKPYSDKVDFEGQNWVIQPKLDGVRCLAKFDEEGKVTLWTRTGKQIKSVPHIAKDLEELGQPYPGAIYDGELYNHELKDDFQELLSCIKRDKVVEKSKIVQYHIYDLVDEDKTFDTRNIKLKAHMLQLPSSTSLVPVSTTAPVLRASDLKTEAACWVDKGYEGIMLRDLTSKYKINGRSSGLLKFKDFMDEEFKIVGASEDKGKMAGQCTFDCAVMKDYTYAGPKDPNNVGVFSVKMKGTDAQRKQQWEDFKAGNMLGKMMTVRFFAYTTSEIPMPRFPVGVAVRDYE